MLAYCSACRSQQPFNATWRALHIDGNGDLRITRPEAAGAIEFERPDTAFACGEGTALLLVERYLHSGTFSLIDRHVADDDDAVFVSTSTANNPFLKEHAWTPSPRQRRRS